MIIFAWLISTILWLAVWIPFYLLGYISTWLGLLFCNRDSEHMPWPFWFWDSNAGINGTLRYENLNWVHICNSDINWNVPNPLKIAMKIVDDKTGNERTYKNRWLWVTWRNPVTNVSRYFIGREARKFSKRAWTLGPFKLERLLVTLGWSYAFTWQFTKERGFFYRFGWKYDDIQQNRACFIYRISPWKAL